MTSTIKDTVSTNPTVSTKAVSGASVRSSAVAIATVQDILAVNASMRADAVVNPSTRATEFGREIGEPPPTNLFRLRPRLVRAGVSQIPASFVVNGKPGAELFRYYGKDASLLGLPAAGSGPSLVVAGAGAPPELSQPVPWEDGFDSFKLNNGGQEYRHPAASGGFPDVATGTDDFFIEGVFWRGAGVDFAPGGLQVQPDGSAFGGLKNGWVLEQSKFGAGNQSPSIRLQVYDNGVSQSLEVGHRQGAWSYFCFGVSISAGLMVGYGGAELVDWRTITSTDLTPQNVRDWIWRCSSAPGGGRIAYLAGWKRPVWWSTISDANSAVRGRAARLCGMLPELADGTRTPLLMSATTSVFGNASRAFDKIDIDGERRVYFFSDNMPRVTRVKDVDGVSVEGYLAEDVGENVLLWSQDMTQATWTAQGVTVSHGARPGPSTDQPFDDANDLIPTDTLDAERWVRAGDALSDEACCSVWAKAGQADWLLIEIHTNPSTGNNDIARAWFNVATHTLGAQRAFRNGAQLPNTVNIGGTHAFDGAQYVDGWSRCSFSVRDLLDGVSAAEVRFGFVSDNLATTFQPVDTVNAAGSLWGAQQEGEIAGNRIIYPIATQLMKTDGVAHIRPVDDVRFDGSDGNVLIGGADELTSGRLLMSMIMLTPVSFQTARALSGIEAAAVQALRLRVGNDMRAEAQTRTGAASESASVSAPDPNTITEKETVLAATWKTGELLSVYQDAFAAASLAVPTLPTGPGFEIHVGHSSLHIETIRRCTHLITEVSILDSNVDPR